MQRKAKADVQLSNGTVIPKGAFIAVSTHRHWYDHWPSLLLMGGGY